MWQEMERELSEKLQAQCIKRERANPIQRPTMKKEEKR